MDRVTKSTPKNIIDLYTKIPDYAEVKHLGNSEFINTIEKLKEEFRQIRSSLYEDSDVELITEKTTRVLNIQAAVENRVERELERRRTNILSSRCNSTGDYIFTTDTVAPNFGSRLGIGTSGYKFNNDCLEVKSCQLYRSQFAAAQNLSSAQKPGSPFYYSSLKFSSPVNLESKSKSDSAFHDADDDDNDDDGVSNGTGTDTESGGTTPYSSRSSPLSRWSSNPEISYSRNSRKLIEYVPPSNIENRLLQRKSQNRSEPIITKSEEEFKALTVHPVPAHVKKLLFSKIMLKNEKRSQRVRETSKQKLLSQMKPFSFTNRNERFRPRYDKRTNEQSPQIESLNNTRPVKTRKQLNLQNYVKTNNNKFDAIKTHLFKAKPAPPRSRALLAALRLREQQEYRELKKRLRSETLMKTASLPPSMAARDKETKESQSRLQTILNKLENVTRQPKIRNRRRLDRSSSTETTYTDDDRMTDSSCSPKLKQRTHKVTTIVEPFKFSNGGKYSSSSRLFLVGKNSGVFESTANDNNASRLRVQAAKRKEGMRLKLEEEEELRLMRTENARQNLRSSKLQVWRRACSYSSSQDIAMRRQLRTAASILERHNFQKDMSSMLNRVRSAPLLLEGVRERKFEPCKKHLEEMLHLSDRSIKFNTPRLGKTDHNYSTRMNWTSRGDGLDDRCGTEFSETAALAEGTITNSDNESVRNIELDSDQDEDKDMNENRDINCDDGNQVILEEIENDEEPLHP